MKQISLLKSEIDGGQGKKFPVVTLEIITAAMDQGPKEGLDMKTVRARLRFDKAIAKLTPESEVLELDAADFKTLQDAIEPTRWIGRNIVVNTLIGELFADEDENPLKSV